MSERGTSGGSGMPPSLLDEGSTTYYGGDATRTAGEGGSMPQGGQTGQGGGSTAGQAMEKATQAAGQAQEKASQVADQARQQAGQVAAQVSTKADAGIEKAAGGLDRAADMLRQKSEQMGGQGSGIQSVATQAATQLDTAAQFLKDKDTDQLMADLEDLVRRKPAQTLLVAAGVGFLLSKVVR